MGQPEFKRFEPQSELQRQVLDDYTWLAGAARQVTYLCIFISILASIRVLYYFAREPIDYFVFTLGSVIIEFSRPYLILALVTDERLRASSLYYSIVEFLTLLTCVAGLLVIVGLSYVEAGNTVLILFVVVIMALGAGLQSVVVMSGRYYQPTPELEIVWAPSEGIVQELASPQEEPVRLERADKVEKAEREFLVPGMISYGDFTIFAGPGGQGKTTASVAIAAAVSSGGMLPDGSIATRARAMIIEGEDDIETETVPDLEFAGADLSRIHVAPHLGESEPLSAEILERYAGTLPPKSLVVLSPIRGLFHDNALPYNEVRQRLSDIRNWAKRRDLAVILIMHPVKGKADVLAGSDAYLSRTRMLLMVDQSNPEAKAFRIAKTNIGIVGRKFHYRIEGQEGADSGPKRVVWLPDLNQSGPPSLSLDLTETAPRSIEGPPQRGKVEDDADYAAHVAHAGGGARIYSFPGAAPHASHASHDGGDGLKPLADEWLKEKLKGGPMKFADLSRMASEEGVCAPRTLQDSRARLGVKVRRLPGNASEWSL